MNSPGKTIPSNCFWLPGISVTDSGSDSFRVINVCVPGPPLKLAIMLYDPVNSWHQHSFYWYALDSNEWYLKELSSFIMWKVLQQLNHFFPFSFHVNTYYSWRMFRDRHWALRDLLQEIQLSIPVSQTQLRFINRLSKRYWFYFLA